MSLATFLKIVIAISVAAKFISTLVLSVSDRAVRDRAGWGSLLWWTSKISPFIALPAFAWLSLLERDNKTAVFFGILVVIAFVAVIFKVRIRRRRIER